MAASLSDTLKGLISSRLVEAMSAGLAESREGVGSGLDLAFTALLGGLLKSQDDAHAMTAVAVLAADPALQGGTLARVTANAAHLLQTVDIGSVVVPGPGSTIQMAATPAPAEPAMLLGEKFNATILGISIESVHRAIASISGIRPASARSILALAAPIVLIALAHRLTGVVIDGPAVAGVLQRDRGRSVAAIHPAIAGPLGLGSLIGDGQVMPAAPAGAVVVAPTESDATSQSWPQLFGGGTTAAIATASASAATTNGGAGSLPPGPVSSRPGTRPPISTRFVWAWFSLLALLALALIGWLIFQFWAQGMQATTLGGTPTSLLRRVLPDGTTVTIRSESVEQRLLGDIEDRWSVVTRSRWLEIDGLNFEIASAEVTPESRVILARLAQIMRAYPSVRIKIGGYTDNQGEPEANRRLSEQRALAVMTLLRDDGIAANRLEAEGYGESSPIADNATPEGRARNRRIALQILQR